MSTDNTNDQNRGQSTGSQGSTHQGTSGQAAQEVHVTRSVDVEQSDDRSVADKAKDNPKTTAAVVGGVAAAAVGAVAAGMANKDSDKKTHDATVQTTEVQHDRSAQSGSTHDTNRTTTGQSGYSSSDAGASSHNSGQTTPSQSSTDGTNNRG